MKGPDKNILTQYLTELKDIVYRETKLIWKYYRPFSFGKNCASRNIYVADGKVPLGGMFDRLKGIITIYAISKFQNKEFKIHFNHPFQLQKYLEPNKYDWSIDSKDVVYNYPKSRPIFAFGEYTNPHRLFKQRKGETHFLYGYDSLDKVNEYFGTNYNWGKLYRELFKPTQYLQQYIDSYKQEIGSEYIVVHTRFLNLLGDKMETDINPKLPDVQKTLLISRCIDKIKDIADNTKFRIMIASDSMTFIEAVKKEIDDVYIVPGQVRHIGTAKEVDDSENIKMFVDYYLIAGANKVYSIVGEGMWQSAFPEYAAKIGGVEFSRLFIDE